MLKDGNYLFSASADKTARAYDLRVQQDVQVAAHAEAVSAIRWINAPTGGYLATSSWDKTLKVLIRSFHCCSYISTPSAPLSSIGI